MNTKLENLRKQIDTVDEKILTLLSKRISIVRKIGKLKKENGIKLLDEKRWRQLLDSRLSKADSLDLPGTLIKEIYGFIHKYSLDIEKNSK